MKVYVDCDDTLVTWLGSQGGPHPYGAFAEKWEPNRAVIAYVEEAHANGAEIVVWSGGGKDYAETWGQRLLGHIPHVAHAKFNAIAGPGDVFLDDMPFDSWKHAAVHPRELA